MSPKWLYSLENVTCNNTNKGGWSFWCLVFHYTWIISLREGETKSRPLPPAPLGWSVVRWCWVNCQCRGVLLVWITVGQGRTALAVGAGVDIFTLRYLFFLLSPSLWEKARYRLKYCLKGPLRPKQPTNQPTCTYCK